MLITISREFGAGGSRVAALIAESLGWTLVDNEFIDLVAKRAGLSPEEVARREERVPGFIERLARTLAVTSQEFAVPQPDAVAVLAEPELVRLTEAVVREVAALDHVVLVGRSATTVLARREGAFHVRIVAPRPFRVRMIQEREGLDAKHAEARVEQVDAQRARYHREYYDRDWTDPALYHMVLNTEALGFAGAAEVVVGWVRVMGAGSREQGAEG
jgi:cytidylate kinase